MLGTRHSARPTCARQYVAECLLWCCPDVLSTHEYKCARALTTFGLHAISTRSAQNSESNVTTALRSLTHMQPLHQRYLELISRFRWLGEPSKFFWDTASDSADVFAAQTRGNGLTFTAPTQHGSAQHILSASFLWKRGGTLSEIDSLSRHSTHLTIRVCAFRESTSALAWQPWLPKAGLPSVRTSAKL